MEFAHHHLAQPLQLVKAGQFLGTEGIDDVRFLGLDEGLQAAHVARHVPGQMRVYIQVDVLHVRVQRKKVGRPFW
jgi:hypothetical protein